MAYGGWIYRAVSPESLCTGRKSSDPPVKHRSLELEEVPGESKLLVRWCVPCGLLLALWYPIDPALSLNPQGGPPPTPCSPAYGDGQGTLFWLRSPVLGARRLLTRQGAPPFPPGSAFCILALGFHGTPWGRQLSAPDAQGREGFLGVT